MSMSTEQVQILIQAVDNASQTLQNISANTAKMASGFDSASVKVNSFNESQKQVSISARDLVYSFAAVGTSLLALWNAYNNIERSQIAIDRMNVRLEKTQRSLTQATDKYNQLVNDTAVDVDKLAHAELSRDKANQSLSKAQDAVVEAQRNLNIAIRETGSESYDTLKAMKELQYAQENVGFATTEAGFAAADVTAVKEAVGPKSEAAQAQLNNIQILQDQLSYQTDMLQQAEIQKNEAWVQAIITIPLAVTTLVGALATLTTAVGLNTIAHGGASTVPAVATTTTAAAVGTGVVAGGVAAYGVEGVINQALENARKAEAATLPINQQNLITSSNLANPPNLLTGANQYKGLGILEADNAIVKFFNDAGKSLTDWWNGIFGGTVPAPILPKKAEGGVITRPTALIAGESGPEAIVPLDKADFFGGVKEQTVTIYTTINIKTVSSNVDVKAMAVQVSEQISEKLRRRR